jgi:hypothetical protein
MERIQVLGNTNLNSWRLGNITMEVTEINEEGIDMRRYIDKFKKQDFKLRQLFDIFNNGLSFRSVEYHFNDRKDIF